MQSLAAGGFPQSFRHDPARTPNFNTAGSHHTWRRGRRRKCLSCPGANKSNPPLSSEEDLQQRLAELRNNIAALKNNMATLKEQTEDAASGHRHDEGVERHEQQPSFDAENTYLAEVLGHAHALESGDEGDTQAPRNPAEMLAERRRRLSEGLAAATAAAAELRKRMDALAGKKAAAKEGNGKDTAGRQHAAAPASSVSQTAAGGSQLQRLHQQQQQQRLQHSTAQQPSSSQRQPPQTAPAASIQHKEEIRAAMATALQAQAAAASAASEAAALQERERLLAFERETGILRLDGGEGVQQEEEQRPDPSAWMGTTGGGGTSSTGEELMPLGMAVLNAMSSVSTASAASSNSAGISMPQQAPIASQASHQPASSVATSANRTTASSSSGRVPSPPSPSGPAPAAVRAAVNTPANHAKHDTAAATTAAQGRGAATSSSSVPPSSHASLQPASHVLDGTATPSHSSSTISSSSGSTTSSSSGNTTSSSSTSSSKYVGRGMPVSEKRAGSSSSSSSGRGGGAAGTAGREKRVRGGFTEAFLAKYGWASSEADTSSASRQQAQQQHSREQAQTHVQSQTSSRLPPQQQQRQQQPASVPQPQSPQSPQVPAQPKQQQPQPATLPKQPLPSQPAAPSQPQQQPPAQPQAQPPRVITLQAPQQPPSSSSQQPMTPPSQVQVQQPKQEVQVVRGDEPKVEPMDIVFVAAEVAPWSKTGGLGDVMGSLPKALAARGHRVMVVTPRYLGPDAETRYKGVTDTKVTKLIDLGNQGGRHSVGFWHMHKDHVDWVFVDHISYHRPGVYGNEHGPYQDNLFRFALLSMASIEATLLLDIKSYRHKGVSGGGPYGQRCLFVANDWHAGMVPVYLAAHFRPHKVHLESRCVLGLHNLSHQGSYPPSAFATLGLPGDWYGAMEWVVNEKNGGGRTVAMRTINCLKAALVTCDMTVTVSQNYAAEVCDDEGGQGCGLGSLLAGYAEQVRGIVNGVDVSEWDPKTDPFISPFQYDAHTLEKKRDGKAALQAAVNLPPEEDRPVVGFIGRLDYQKGPDLVLAALPYLINLDCQVVMLGSGAPDYEEGLRRAQREYPYFVRGITKFDVKLAHRIIAGCDILLMPSRFEPCGLNQLYAMRYGTVPIAHSTGGLRDTIDDFNMFAPPGSSDRGTGWTFSPATVEALVDATSAAVQLYKDDPEEWAALQKRCMAQDFSWDRAARQYEHVFTGVMRAEIGSRAAKEATGVAAMRKREVQLKVEAEEAARAAAAEKAKAQAEERARAAAAAKEGKDKEKDKGGKPAPQPAPAAANKQVVRVNS